MIRSNSVTAHGHRLVVVDGCDAPPGYGVPAKQERVACSSRHILLARCAFVLPMNTNARGTQPSWPATG